ncbi:MAG TPA: ATPase [Methanomicrobia archaeon]|nr:MAG: ATPase [Thermococci archaeon]RLF92820.1 MAG: ATPase [Thermococci archaeon]HDN81520.1 ATPase [Methanomicrobia archaeon]HEC95879.1 ATPase [Euryarchaeota archaeon]
MFRIKKRDGTLEEFIPEKIVVSCVKSGADLETAREISNEIKRTLKEKTDAEKLREKVLELLEEKNPQWKENWLLYDRAVKRRL